MSKTAKEQKTSSQSRLFGTPLGADFLPKMRFESVRFFDDFREAFFDDFGVQLGSIWGRKRALEGAKSQLG